MVPGGDLPDPAYTDALAYALRLLRVRGRTRQELDLALGRRAFSEDVRARVLARLQELGYLDDARLAQARAASLLERGRLAPAAIRQRLRQSGVEEAEARKAVESAAVEAGFEAKASARRMLEARRLIPGSLDVRAHARAARLLASRGFDEDTIAEVLGEPEVESPGEDG